MKTPQRLLLLGLAGTLASTAFAYDSPSAKAPVPAHACPWIETRQPDIRTIFLWKFISEKDRDAEVATFLEKGDLGELTAGKGGVAEGLGESAAATEPKLGGDARPVADTGRFGGGLAVNGAGFAEGSVNLTGLLKLEGGFTVDFWFRAGASGDLRSHSGEGMPSSRSSASLPHWGGGAPAPEDGVPDAGNILLSIPDAAGKPLMTATWSGATSVVFTVAGKEGLRVPCRATHDGWHHLALAIDAPRGQPDNARIFLTVDGQTAQAKPIEDNVNPIVPVPWFKGMAAKVGARLQVGGAPGVGGLRGVLDEVRLAKGVNYLYPWNRGAQELARQPKALEMKSPFFKNLQRVTHFGFDGTLKPETAAPLNWTGKDDAALFQGGLQGQALDLSKIDQAGFKIPGYYFLPEKDGTIEFWFRPLDWNNFFLGGYDGEGVQFYHLMQLRSKEAPYGTPTKDLEVLRGRSAKTGNLPWQKFHPGTWTHVLISVQDSARTVYVNGRQQALWQAGYVTQGHPYAQEPLKKWLERTGGKDVDDTWTWQFAPSPTLIDEFSVYSRGLSDEEAWNAYARWLPDATEQMKAMPLLRAECEYFAHSWDNVEKFVARVEALAIKDLQPASADFLLRNEKGETVWTVEKQPLDAGGTTTFTWQKPLPFGRYAVTVRSRAGDGTVLKEEKQEYVRERPAWLGNTLGEERTVPKSWTPITVAGRKLGIIGRELELGANGLPARIETLKKSLLAAPVKIRITTAAGPAEMTGKGPEFTETAPDRVAWKTVLEGGGLKADLDAWMEFDGLLYCAVTLKPAGGAELTLAELDVDVPMNPEAATQLLVNGGGGDFRASLTGRNPVPAVRPGSPQAGTGSVWDSLEKPYPAFCRADGVTNFMPHIWLGADDIGLYFGAENDQGWTVDGPKPAQEVVREENATIFRMNVIREPTFIPAAGRRFHFILLPTPAKPEPADWRHQMLSGGVNFGACDTFGGFDLKGGAFRLEPQSWEHAAEMAPKCRQKWGGRCILYADAAHPELGPAFRDWNHDMFAGTGRLAWTPECEDYAVWAVNEFLKRGVIDGIYWDDVSVGYTYSLASTGYAYAGSPNGRRVGFTALAQRRVNMRLWRLFEAAGKEPCIWAHMTFCYEVPLFSFCRYLSNCEFVTGVEFPNPRDAMDMWSPETLRWLAGSAKWGTGYQNLSTLPRALPGGGAAQQWAYPQRRTETGLYLTSDIMGPADGLGQVLAREKVFAGPVTAYPWWKSAAVVTLQTPAGAKVYAGVYALEDRAVVILFNGDREEREVGVELVAGKLLPGATEVVWRDIDPGLQPPAKTMASAKEIKEATAMVGDFAEKEKPADDAALEDLLNGTTPEGRAQERLKLRTEGNKARVVIRPRDYRVLEANRQ